MECFLLYNGAKWRDFWDYFFSRKRAAALEETATPRKKRPGLAVTLVLGGTADKGE